MSSIVDSFPVVSDEELSGSSPVDSFPIVSDEDLAASAAPKRSIFRQHGRVVPGTSAKLDSAPLPLADEPAAEAIVTPRPSNLRANQGNEARQAAYNTIDARLAELQRLGPERNFLGYNFGTRPQVRQPHLEALAKDAAELPTEDLQSIIRSRKELHADARNVLSKELSARPPAGLDFPGGDATQRPLPVVAPGKHPGDDERIPIGGRFIDGQTGQVYIKHPYGQFPAVGTLTPNELQAVARFANEPQHASIQDFVRDDPLNATADENLPSGYRLAAAVNAELAGRSKDQIAQGLRYAIKRVPFGRSSWNVLESRSSNKALNRIEEGRGSTDDYRIAARLLADGTENEKKSILQHIGDGITALPAFFTELALTEGAAGLGGKALQSAASAGRVGPAGQAISKFAGSAMAQSAVQPAVLENIAAAQAPTVQNVPDEFGAARLAVQQTGRGPVENVLRGYADTLAEVGSERAGEVIWHALGALGKHVAPETAAALCQAYTRFQATHPGAKAAEFLKHLQDPVTESLEERLGEVTGGALGTGDYGLIGSLASGDLEAAKKRALIEAGILLPAGGVGVAVRLPGARDAVAQTRNEAQAKANEPDAELTRRLDAIEEQYRLEQPQRDAAESRRTLLKRARAEATATAQTPADAEAENTAAPVEEQKNDIVSQSATSQVQNAGPEATTRKINPRRPVEQAPEANGIEFTTALGSSYHIDTEGRTTRTKTPHPGHESADVGEKQRSDRTVYVSPEDAREIGMHNTLNVPDGKPIVQLQDDGIYLAQEQNGQRTWSKQIPFSTTPEIGKAPVEFWNDGRNHPGNPITAIQKKLGGKASSYTTNSGQTPANENLAGRPEQDGRSPHYPVSGPASNVEPPQAPTVSAGGPSREPDEGSPRPSLPRPADDIDTAGQSSISTESLTPDEALARWVSNRLENPKPISDREFFEQADKHFGGTRAEGKYGDSRAYDALERGVNTHLLTESDPTADVSGAKETVAKLESLAERLPTHKSRTGNKDLLQQFSTPPAYAYVANWAANPKVGDVVLEPSAGTGGLVTHAVNSGAKVYANEIDPARASLVGQLPVENVFREDAEHVGGILGGKMPAPSVVVMNPPFSRAGHRLGAKKVVGTDRKHIDEALHLLRPGGRLVAIVGAGLHGRGVGFDNWLSDLPYAVRADVEVGRDVYKGYGTTFPTRLLVIDKIPKDDQAQRVSGKAETLPALIDLLQEVRNARATVTEQQPAEPTGTRRLGQRTGEPRPAVPVQPPTGELRPGQQASPGSRAGESVPAPADREREPDVRVGPAGSAEGPSESVGREGGNGRVDRGGGEQPGSERAEEGQRLGEPGQSAHGQSVGELERAGRTDNEAGERSVAQVKVEPARKVKKAALGESTYEPYQPHVHFEDAAKHPASIVESAAMAAVQPVAVTYRPHIPQRVIQGYTADDGTKVGISDVQLEAVAAAGQAHELMLPDGTRRGFMIGDGTGVGKAREIAGIILDNWNQGRRKAVWVSKNAALLDPARDEWKRVGGDPAKVLAQAKVPVGTSITAPDGILFTTYPMLSGEASEQATAKGNTKSRLEQILDWVGPDFDGVIVFDEAHEMRSAMDVGKGLGKKKASQKALSGLDLQSKLPKARIVYLSATSATEVENLAYAQRLGLWGEGTSFANRDKFVSAISAGGVAAMEKVAADMKGLGMYLARSIAFNDGTPEGTVTYDRIEHRLTDDQRRAYDKMAEAWGHVLANMNDALELTGGKKDGRAMGRARSNFWSANQRFWNQVISAMQTPAVIKAIEKDLEEGRSSVVQLTNTNEAQQNRALADLQEGEDLGDADLSPRQILMDYLERSFPTTKYEQYTDENGNIRSRPVVDSQGNPVRDPRAVALKEKLLDELGSLQVANRGALDMIIDRFGPDAVAEITGRSERLVTVDGKVMRQRRTPSSRKADVNDFMDGRKRILVFSEAGGTGASYHADKSRTNQQPRSHYLLQAGWRADSAIQGLGRTHRSNQAQAPKYLLVHTDLKGQKRFISTIARRLSQLGALTKGQRQAGESGVFKATDNLESTEARDALQQFYKDAVGNEIADLDLAYLENTLGLVMRDKDGNLKAELPPITQFLNRVLSLPVDQQNRVFDEFQSRLDAKVEQAVARGTLDQGMETVKADRIDKESEQVVYRHPTGAEAKHVVVKVFRKMKPRTWQQVQSKKVTRYVKSAQTGKVWVVEDTGTTEQDDKGQLSKRVRMLGPVQAQYSTEHRLNNAQHWSDLDESEARRAWEQQLASLPELHEDEMHLLTGVLLPIWDRLPRGTAQVKRLLTSEGEEILGRVIPSSDVQRVLNNLGASTKSATLTPQQAIDAVMAGKTVTLVNDWKVKRSRVDGEWSVELVGPDFSYDRELERQGVFKRRVQFRTRYFLPSGKEAANVLAAVTKDRPIVSVSGQGDEGGDLALTETRERKSVTRQSRSATVTGPKQAEIAAADIIKTWERLFGVPIRVGGFSKRAAGLYKVLPEVVRTKESHYASLAVGAHEIAHHIDKQTHIAGGDARHAPQIPSHLRGEVRGLDYEPKGRLFEGFAEFIRHYITEGDAQVLAPGFFHWFEHEWMPAHPKWAKPLREAQQQARQYADQTVLQRVRSAIGRPGDDLSWTARLKQRASSFGNWVVRSWLDRAAPLQAIQEEAAKRGADYSTKAGPHELFMAYDLSAQANAAQALETGVHALTDGRKLSDGLWPLAKDLNNDIEREEAIAYAWARHTLHEAESKPKYNTGLDVEDAKRIVEYVEADEDKYERYEKVAAGLANYANGTLDMLVDAGALSPEARDRMVDRYGEFYFPLLRVQDKQLGMPTGGTRFVNLPKAVLGRSQAGGGRPIMDPFDAMVALTIQRYSRAVKARIAHSLAETLDPKLGGVEGMGSLMDRIDPRRKVQQGTIDDVLNTLVAEGVVEADDAKAMRIAQRIRSGEDITDKSRKWFAERHGLPVDADLTDVASLEPDPLATISLWRSDYTPSAKKATVLIHGKDGKPVLYEMDRELYNTATGMDGLQFGAFANLLRSASQVFKAGAVGISTGFGVSNIIRDFLEYQGRAENVKGIKSALKPVEMVGRYIGYKARQRAGLPTDDALIETFEAAGGKLFTRLGSDIATRQRTRERKLGKPAVSQLLSPLHVKDAALSASEGLQDFIAWTDAPPRLAEMEAMGRKLGFEARGAAWYDRVTGEKVNLPEYARVRMLNAAAEATVNFKRAGSMGRWLDSFLPFFNATLQASYREARQLGSLRRIGDSGEAQHKALRYLVYLCAAASTGWLYWLLRHDDDDYRESEPWLKQNYWTWGRGGRTYLRVPKPRDFGQLASNLMEAALDRLFHDDSDKAIGNVLGHHALQRLPDGGGPLRAGIETLVADYDYFRDRPLTPDYLKDEPKALQATPYTLETSKVLGQIAGPVLSLSPIQVEHLLNGSSGGAYRRIVDTLEAGAEGRLGPEHIPFVRGLVLNRHQARSIDDLYRDWEQVKLQSKWEATTHGEPSADTARKKARLDDYAELMTDIRKLDKRDLRGRRKMLYEPLLVGLAREALGREPLEENPSPFTKPELPDEVKKVIVDFAERKAKVVILSHGMPTKIHQGDSSLDDTMATWHASRDADEAWLKEHAASPYVRQAIEAVQSSKGFHSLLRRQGRPVFQPRSETPGEYQQQLRRFNEKAERVSAWQKAVSTSGSR